MSAASAIALPDPLPSVGGTQQLLRRLFTAAGLPSPESDADLLLAGVLNCRRSELFLCGGNSFLPAEEKLLRELCGRRLTERMPLQYLFGRASFYNIELRVTPAVLIPRPETELIVDELVKRLPPGGRLLDLGTGSGAITLAALTERPDVTAVAVDVSAEALAVAQSNAAELQLEERVAFRLSNLCGELASDEKFDAVAANLPYVTEEEYPLLDPEVRLHEPKIALTAPDRGLEVMTQSIHELPRHLKEGGFAIWELSPFQAPLIAAEVERNGAWCGVEILRDLTGRERFVMAERTAD